MTGTRPPDGPSAGACRPVPPHGDDHAPREADPGILPDLSDVAITQDATPAPSVVVFDSLGESVQVAGELEARQFCLAHGLVDEVRKHLATPSLDGLAAKIHAAFAAQRADPGRKADPGPSEFVFTTRPDRPRA